MEELRISRVVEVSGLKELKQLKVAENSYVGGVGPRNRAKAGHLFGEHPTWLVIL